MFRDMQCCPPDTPAAAMMAAFEDHSAYAGHWLPYVRRYHGADVGLIPLTDGRVYVDWFSGDAASVRAVCALADAHGVTLLRLVERPAMRRLLRRHGFTAGAMTCIRSPRAAAPSSADRAFGAMLHHKAMTEAPRIAEMAERRAALAAAGCAAAGAGGAMNIMEGGG